MKHNMGNKEKNLRLFVGALLFALGWLVSNAFGVFGTVATTLNVLGIIIALAGIVAFVTGVISYCPVSALLKHNSCEACRLGETHKHLPV